MNNEWCSMEKEKTEEESFRQAEFIIGQSDDA